MNYLSRLQAYPDFCSDYEFEQPNFLCVCKRRDGEKNNDFKRIKEIFQIDINSNIELVNEIKVLCYLKNAVINSLHLNGENIIDRKYDNMTYLDIISNSRRNGDVLNCRYKSFIFSQLLSLYGYKVRWVGCLPMDADDEECHCVTEVFSLLLKKWIAVDVSFDYFYFDSNGTLLNLIEIRNNLICGKRIGFISKSRQEVFNTKRYLEKNLFKFRFIELCDYNSTIDSGKTILLYPRGYSLGDAEKKCFSRVTNNILPFWGKQEEE